MTVPAQASRRKPTARRDRAAGRPAVPRPVLPAAAGLVAGLVAALVIAAAAARWRRRNRPVDAPTLPADELPHDGLQTTQSQAVLLSGGPSDGSYLSVAWGVREFTVQDEERTDHCYREAGTERGPGGEPVRVFRHTPAQLS